MNVIIVGEVPSQTREKILNDFPKNWNVKIFASENISDDDLKIADVIIPEHLKINSAFLDRTPRLKFIQTGVGFDNVDVEECTRRSIQVCNASGVNANAVAEHVIALILCFYKKIIYLDGAMKENSSQIDYAAGEISGKTIGIIGLGNIGRRVAKFCNAFDMRVLGWSYKPVEIDGVKLAGLHEIFSESDIISVHVPLKDSTRRMINAESFSQMKNNALIVNTSRGAVIDETQLIHALENKIIGGACLDVFEHEPLPNDSPLRKMKNVILTPHTAGAPDSVKYHKKRYEFFAKNISDFFNGLAPKNKIN